MGWLEGKEHLNEILSSSFVLSRKVLGATPVAMASASGVAARPAGPSMVGSTSTPTAAARVVGHRPRRSLEQGPVDPGLGAT